MKFQGVVNVVRFNWHFYLTAFLLAAVFLVAGRTLQQPLISILGLAFVAQALVSIVVSYLVYDRSGLYDFAWLDDMRIADGSSVVNIHSGFDETSEPLIKKFPRSNFRIFDFYEAKDHTEVSIKRARKAAAANADAIKIKTREIPVSNDSIDVCFVIFSAHEIRDDPERIAFFRELGRALKNSGRIVVTEHLRDAPNILAYNLGALHFLNRSVWLTTFAKANLRMSNEIKITPFVTSFVLEKDGTAP